MAAENYAVLVALVAGSVRALLLWRASARVDVVNVAVLNALSAGRGRQLAALLGGAGSGIYLEVARSLAETVLAFRPSTLKELRQHLQRKQESALIAASRRLSRHAWLDVLALIGIAFAGIGALVAGRASAPTALGLLAGTLLWFANVRSARSLLTRVHAGGDALVDSLMAACEPIWKAHDDAPARAPNPPHDEPPGDDAA